MDDSNDLSNDVLSSDDDDVNWAPVAALLATIYSRRQSRMPSNRTYAGQEYVDDLLNCNNDVHI
jgi:hypothetical protein